jgi:hypothetical protein
MTTEQPKPRKLLDHVRDKLRVKHSRGKDGNHIRNRGTIRLQRDPLAVTGSCSLARKTYNTGAQHPRRQLRRDRYSRNADPKQAARTGNRLGRQPDSRHLSPPRLQTRRSGPGCSGLNRYLWLICISNKLCPSGSSWCWSQVAPPPRSPHPHRRRHLRLPRSPRRHPPRTHPPCPRPRRQSQSQSPPRPRPRRPPPGRQRVLLLSSRGWTRNCWLGYLTTSSDRRPTSTAC